MKILSALRGAGKTEKIIDLAYETGYPIVVLNGTRKKLIEDRIKYKGWKIPVYTVLYYKEHKQLQHKPILLDDLDDIIQSYLETNVVLATITED